MEKIVLDKGGDFGIKFSWKEDDPYWVDFKGVETVSDYIDNNNPNFLNYNLGGGIENEQHDIEKDFEMAFKENSLMQGFIKWDGCMEIHNFNHHFCSQDTFMQRIIDCIYNNAREIMKDKYQDY